MGFVMRTGTPHSPRPKPTGTERRGNKNMKYFAIIALAAMAIGFVGCASKESTPAPAPATHGMSK